MSDAPDTELPPVLERDYAILLNDVGPDGELRSCTTTHWADRAVDNINARFNGF